MQEIGRITVNMKGVREGALPAPDGPLRKLVDQLRADSADKDQKLAALMAADECTVVYFACGSCANGGARVEYFCGNGGSEPDYVTCEPC